MNENERLQVIRVKTNPSSKPKARWTAKDATRHNKKASTPRLKRMWAHTANSEFARLPGTVKAREGRAIAAANAVIDRARPRKNAGRAHRRTAPREPRSSYIIEVMHEKKGIYHFCYWTGKKLVNSRSHAKHFARSQLAEDEARKVMKNRAPSYRFARVVPA
jgi:hypothetical protein